MMTPEGERLEIRLRAEHDDFDAWDAFSQMAALTRLWLEERGVVVGFLKLPTQKQMAECAFDIMRDSVAPAGSA